MGQLLTCLKERNTHSVEAVGPLYWAQGIVPYGAAYSQAPKTLTW